MSTGPVFNEVQKINPSAIIELFVLELSTSLHGTNTGITTANNENNIYRFHSGSNLNANGVIVWASKQYARFPIEATGFAYQRGQIPRPKLIISNALGTISIDRKATETREVVEFELAGSIDMVGVRAPKRQCTRSLFPSIGTFIG